MSRPDLLLFHAYFLADDPHEQQIMRPFPPLGLQYLVAYLRREGFDADWIDSTFRSGPDDVLREIDAASPRAVGLYGHTITRPVARGMIAACRDAGRRIIAGGPDPVQYLDEYFAMGVEVVVIGEGEHTTADLLRHLDAHGGQWDFASLGAVPGIAFRRDGRIVRTDARPLIRQLDQLPWPARERRDHDAYFAAWRARHGATAMSLVTSRGCPYHCTWCSKQVYGDTFRRRSVDDVVAEVVHLRERWNPDQLWFADDMFTINRRWVHRFARALRAAGAVTPFYLVGRPETLDPETCALLAEAGCTRIYVSAESGAQHVLDAMRKESTVDDIRTAARVLRAAGIELGVFVMIGYPGETAQDVDATLQMLHDIAPDVTLLSVAHPMKGTAFYEAVADRLEMPPGWERTQGGRLAFRMEYPRAYYDFAQKMIWSETTLVRKLRTGSYDAELVQAAVKAPLWRMAAGAVARVSRLRPRPTA